MKGFLTYLVLWNLGKKKMNGAELANDLESRRGSRPSPGTLYPALRELKKNGMIKADSRKYYSLTSKGAKELKSATRVFCKIFFDIQEMHRCCR